jgi:hypothetical protein
MTLGQEIKELKAVADGLQTQLAERDTEIEGLKAQIKTATELDNAKALACIEAAEIHANEIKDLQDKLQAVQEDLAGALEANENLTSNLADAEVDEEELEAKEAVIAEKEAVIASKDAKLASPAYQDANTEGEEQAADVDPDNAPTEGGILAEYEEIKKNGTARERTAFYRQHRKELMEATRELRRQAKS